MDEMGILVDVDALREHIAPVDLHDSMAEAGRKILLGDFIKMLENEAGSRSGENIEHVHDMRVATRRMRSAFKLLDTYYKNKPVRPFVENLKTLAWHLGAVRDLDVMIEDLTTHQATLEGDDAEALQKVINKLDKRRGKARRKLVAYLDSPAYGDFVRAYAKFLTNPGKGARKVDESEPVPYQVRHVLPAVIHDHLAQVRAYDNVLEDADVVTLHALRIEFKRLRYAIDYFTEVLGTSVNDYLQELKAIQDHLGRMQDMVVAQERLRVLIEDGLKKPQRQVVSAYHDSLAEHEAKLIEWFPEVWAKFNTRTVQQKLSSAMLTLR